MGQQTSGFIWILEFFFFFLNSFVFLSGCKFDCDSSALHQVDMVGQEEHDKQEKKQRKTFHSLPKTFQVKETQVMFCLHHPFSGSANWLNLYLNFCPADTTVMNSYL